MAESSTSSARLPAALALAAGMALAALAGFGGMIALVTGLLAQPMLALAVSWWRRTRPMPAGVAAAGREAVPVLGIWAVAAVATGVLLAWPLQSLLHSGSLGAALGLSAMASAVLLGLWRTWPLWHALERNGGRLGDLWRKLPQQDAGAWRGLGVAAAVALALAGWLLLAWPGLLPGGWRWPLAALWAVALPCLHLAVQRVAAPAETAAEAG